MKAKKLRRAIYLSMLKSLSDQTKPKYWPKFLWKYFIKKLFNPKIVENILRNDERLKFIDKL